MKQFELQSDEVSIMWYKYSCCKLDQENSDKVLLCEKMATTNNGEVKDAVKLKDRPIECPSQYPFLAGFKFQYRELDQWYEFECCQIVDQYQRGTVHRPRRIVCNEKCCYRSNAF